MCIRIARGLVLSLLLLLLLLQHSLDNLLLLNQEGSDDSLLDTVGASGTTVSSQDGLLRLLDSGVFSWSQSSNALQLQTAVTTLDLGGLLLDVVGDQLATWGLDHLDLVRSGVVCLLVQAFGSAPWWKPRKKDTLEAIVASKQIARVMARLGLTSYLRTVFTINGQGK